MADTPSGDCRDHARHTWIHQHQIRAQSFGYRATICQTCRSGGVR